MTEGYILGWHILNPVWKKLKRIVEESDNECYLQRWGLHFILLFLLVRKTTGALMGQFP
jgi:hypothetical protein